jgi:hypothetical protein
VNLTSAGTWRAPVDEFIPIGPLRVQVQLPSGLRAKQARLLVADKAVRINPSKDRVSFQLQSIVDHEVIVLS